MQILNASFLDLNALRKMEAVCFPEDAWPLFDLLAVLSFPGVVRLKAEVDHNMVGFIAADTRIHENADWIATVCVLPEHRQHGIARALLQACEAKLHLPRIKLCVRVGNTPAIKLYESNGFRGVDMWTKYYRDGADAIVMQKDKM